MTAQYERVHVFHADFAFHRDKRAHASGIKHSRHSEDAILRETADLERGLRHGIQRICHHNDDAVRRMLHDLLDDGLDHVVISLQQVVPTHPRLAGKSRGDHDYVTSGRR